MGQQVGKDRGREPGGPQKPLVGVTFLWEHRQSPGKADAGAAEGGQVEPMGQPAGQPLGALGEGQRRVRNSVEMPTVHTAVRGLT